jgi:hypothetical protein
MANLHLTKIDVSDFINPVYVDISVKINKENFAKDGPNLDKMYSLMAKTLDNALSNEFWMKMEFEAFREVVDAYPDAYDAIEACFFEEYTMNARNREVCITIKDYVKDYLNGMAGIVSEHHGNEDAIISEAKELAMDLKHGLYIDLGIHVDEW